MYPTSKEQYINVSRNLKPGTIIQNNESTSFPAGYHLTTPKSYKDHMMNSGTYDNQRNFSY